MNDYLPTALHRAIDDLFRAVPYAMCNPLWTLNGPSGAVTLSLHVDGWSPTLHLGSHEVATHFQDERRMLAGALDVARRTAEEQAMLADLAAREFGLTQPLPTMAYDARRTLGPEDAEYASRLHIERTLADVLVQQQGPNGAADKLVRAVDSLQRSSMRSGLHMRHGGDEVEVRDGRIVLEPECLIGGPAAASLMGATLSLRTQLPDTIADAAIGRPLGSLVETRLAALDAAPITSVRRLGDTLQLATGSDLVRVGDHPGLAHGLASTCRWRVAA